jgi:hypothetical protein
MTNGFQLGLLAAFLGVIAFAFGKAVLVHHDIPCLPSLLWHSTRSSVGFTHIVVGFRNPKTGDGGKGNTKTATRLLLDVLGQTEPVLQ